ncbi:MAG: PPC domain-containing protein [Candidatus Solibacter usitatus]|nr:PPC domain-containing protein [Candidatus Solibacter usitatus]
MGPIINFILYIFMMFGSAMAQTAGPRQHFDFASDQARRFAKLSLPSRSHTLASPNVHRLKVLSQTELGAIVPKEGAIVVGRHRKVDPVAKSAGVWSTLPDGTRVWRLGIQSPEARAIRLHFTNVAIGPGRLWVHDDSKDESRISGPYTRMGPYADGDFWSDSIDSETVVVEYQPGNGIAVDNPPFEIDEISHFYSDVELKAERQRSAAAACNLDVTCYADWAETAKAVARISFESGGGSYVCSGTLLNTRNNTGALLFLTANHCIDNDTVARTLQAFWSYQTGSCNGAAPSTRNVPRTSGSRLLVTGDRSQGDFTLLRLDSVPSGVMFSGWDAREVAEGTALTVVHHPAGDYKRIAFGNRVANSRTPANYYSVFYSSGLTEGGSSGSGLFSSPMVLTGTLSNGPKADTPEEYCRIIPFADNYGRFSSYYPLLRDILEERNVAPPQPAPGGNHDLTSGVPAAVALTAVSGNTLISGENGYRIVVPQGATRLDIVLTTNTPGVDLDLYARYNTDVVVTSGTAVADHRSDGPTGSEQITITPTSSPALRAGTYYIALGVFTNGVNINATLTATVTTPSAPPPSAGAVALTSGTPRNFTISPVTSSTLLSGGFTIEVPQGATRLDVQLSSTTANVDIDLYLRHGTEPTLSGGSVVFDFSSEGSTASESISVTSTSNPPLRAGTYYMRIGVFTSGVTINATVTATVTGGSTTPPAGTVALTSGTPRNVSIAPVSSNSLLAGSFTIDVPQGATRLDVRLASTTANVDLDLYVRYGSEPALVSGSVTADYRSDGNTATESISVTSASSPPLRAGTYFIRIGIFTPGVAINATVTATVTGGGAPPPPPSSSTIALTSGIVRSFTIAPVSSAALIPGAFTIDVPSGATRLDVRLASSTPGADIDLYVRYNNEPVRTGSGVTADFRAEGSTADELISISSSSTPPLRAGTYFIGVVAFSTGVTINATITATVTTGAAPPPTGVTTLTSGRAQSFSLPSVSSSTLFNGARSYAIAVPSGATRLEINLNTSTPSVDVDLYVRFGSDVSQTGGSIVSDHSSSSSSGSETITITPGSSPPLRAGTYYIALRMYSSGSAASGTITATVTAPGAPPPSTGPTVLTSGVRQAFLLPASPQTVLYNGNRSYVIDVPASATRLDVQLTTTTAGVDVDLYVRAFFDPAPSGGDITYDYGSIGPDGSERVTITTTSNLPLRTGRYYIALAMYSTNIAATGSLVATVTTGSGGPAAPGAATLLTSGVAGKFSLPAVDAPTLYNGNYSFRVGVPEGAVSMRVQLVSDNPSVDVDLYARYERDNETVDGDIAADYSAEGSSGNESFTVTSSSSPPLRPGTYYISLRLYTRGVPATGSVTVTVERGSLPPATSSARELISGVPVNYSLPAVTSPTLFSGLSSFRVNVGPQHRRLAISVRGNPTEVDVDLFARFAQEPSVSEGLIVADFRSTGDLGDEDILIGGANLRPGVYFISLALFTTGVDARGTITATLSTDSSSDPLATSELLDPGMPIAGKAGFEVRTALADKWVLGNKREPLDEPLVKTIETLKKRLTQRTVSQ